MKARILHIAALALTFFLSVSALYGGAMLVLDPTGAQLGLPAEILAATPFASFLVPGLVLLLVIGGGSMVAFLATLFTLPKSPMLVTIIGLALLIWMFIQVVLVGGWQPTQITYLVLGVLIIGAGLAERKQYSNFK